MTCGDIFGVLGLNEQPQNIMLWFMLPVAGTLKSTDVFI
jgi:hypothetical protein